MDCLEHDCHGYDHEDWHPVDLIDIPGTIIIPSSLPARLSDILFAKFSSEKADSPLTGGNDED